MKTMQYLLKLIIPLSYVLIAFSACSSYKYGPTKIRHVGHSHQKPANHWTKNKISASVVHDFQNITYPFKISQDVEGDIVDPKAQIQKIRPIDKPSTFKMNRYEAAVNITGKMNMDDGEVSVAYNLDEMYMKPEGEEEPKTNTMAILALIFGILGFFFPIRDSGIVCGKIAEQEITKYGEMGLGLAQTAVNLGYIALLLYLVFVIIMLVAVFWTLWYLFN